MARLLTMAWLALATSLTGAAWASDDAAVEAKVTDAQKEAVRSHCTGDFLAHCLGVRPGGLPAFQCLDKHMDKLSTPCQAAVKDILADAN